MGPGTGDGDRSPLARARASGADRPERRSRIGLAMAGGGPQGAVYEIGALKALSDGIAGLDLTALHVYVGVSSGGFLGAGLANRMPPEEMVDVIFSAPGQGRNPFRPETFFTPARGEYGRRVAALPRLFGDAVRGWLGSPGDMTFVESLMRLTQALPVGLFDSEPVREYLAELLAEPGRTDDFRELPAKLRVVTADLDAAQAVVFGAPGRDHVPISKAVQASTALPGLYPPVEIEGRYYVDGVLLKTLHASVALDEGAELLFCINPIVPVDTARAVEQGVMRRGKLIDRGLPAVMAQSVRTLIRSRLGAGMSAYDGSYPDADVVLLEPKRDDYRMFFTNVFSFSDRRAVCEHAYRQTHAELLRRREELEPVLARHGMALRLDALRDPDRRPWAPGDRAAEHLRPAPPRGRKGRPAEVDRLEAALDRLDALL